MANPQPPAGGRQISITQRQVRAQAAAAQLLDLVRGTARDGVLSEEETMDLFRWLEANPAEDLPAAGYLREVVERIMADGVITDAERQELHDAVIRVLPPAERGDAKSARWEALRPEQERAETARRLAARARAAEEARANGVWDFMVAGVSFEGRGEVIADHLAEHDPVVLRREPRNPYDPNAVAIHLTTSEGQKIGYVPKIMAVEMAPLLDSGLEPFAFCKRILDRGTYPIPVVVVRMEDERGQPVLPVPLVTAPAGPTSEELLAAPAAEPPVADSESWADPAPVPARTKRPGRARRTAPQPQLPLGCLLGGALVMGLVVLGVLLVKMTAGWK